MTTGNRTDDEQFLDWFAGFVDGEGCFSIRQFPQATGWYTRLQIDLRDDDLDILLEIQDRLGLGAISRRHYKEAGAHDSAVWCVATRADCFRLVSIFDAHPLRAKKRRDYLVWRLAVIENQKPFRMRDLAKMKFLADKIRLIRAYEPQEEITFEPGGIQLSFPTTEDEDENSGPRGY